MSQPEVEPACVGQFVCSLGMLGRLLGLPGHIQIREVTTIQYGIHGQSAVRVVLEDPKGIEEVEQGQEIPQVQPRFKIGGTSYREFVGWAHEQTNEENQDDDDGEFDAD